MKHTSELLVILLLMTLFACGGRLTDEQRKQIREKMDMNKIIRVTEAEITGAAFAKGRSIADKLQGLKYDSARLDSFLRIKQGDIRFAMPGASHLRSLEEELLQAYLADHSGTLQDNVQEKRDARGDYDSLLYTQPVTKKLPDGTDTLVGVWNIWLSKKDLVLEIGKSK